MKTPQVSQSEADAYTDGWAVRHKRGPLAARVCPYTAAKLKTAWLLGFDDCAKGVLDADRAIGPGDRTYHEGP